jgi:protein gp37
MTDPQAWAHRINDAAGKTVEAFINTGRMLLQSKGSVPHGTWERMFSDHPQAVAEPVVFGVRTAQRLMKIAGHPVISKATHASLLPPTWGTLYELTQVPDDALEAALRDGMIRPDMPRDAVIVLKRIGRERRAAERREQAALVLRSPRNETRDAERPYSIADWEALSPGARADVIAQGFDCRTTLNAQPTTDIEWARRSLNTVTGCLHDCPYCYARDIAERVYPQKFAPSFHPARLSAPANEPVPPEARSDPAYGNIFANSMSDLFGQWVPADWIEATIEMARRNPRWRFLVLTKFPQRAQEFDFPENWWMGTTVDAQARVANAERAFERIRCGTKWLSCEPLLQPLTFERLDLFQWVVVGGASSSTKTPAWVPPFDWVAELQLAARLAGCAIYQKTNLKLDERMRVREFPWTKQRPMRVPAPFRYLRGL